MKGYHIHVLLMQETHIKENSQETHLGYRFYFGGDGDFIGREYHGVGLVVSPFMQKHVQSIHPISSRIITVTLGTQIPCTLIGVYAPQSGRPHKEKAYFYRLLRKTYRKASKHGPVWVLGDFNAKTQAPETTTKHCTYYHTPLLKIHPPLGSRTRKSKKAESIS